MGRLRMGRLRRNSRRLFVGWVVWLVVVVVVVVVVGCWLLVVESCYIVDNTTHAHTL